MGGTDINVQINRRTQSVFDPNILRTSKLPDITKSRSTVYGPTYTAHFFGNFTPWTQGIRKA